MKLDKEALSGLDKLRLWQVLEGEWEICEGCEAIIVPVADDYVVTRQDHIVQGGPPVLEQSLLCSKCQGGEFFTQTGQEPCNFDLMIQDMENG